MAHGLPLRSFSEPQEGEKYVLGIDEAGRGPILGAPALPSPPSLTKS